MKKSCDVSIESFKYIFFLITGYPNSYEMTTRSIYEIDNGKNSKRTLTKTCHNFTLNSSAAVIFSSLHYYEIRSFKYVHSS